LIEVGGITEPKGKTRYKRGGGGGGVGAVQKENYNSAREAPPEKRTPPSENTQATVAREHYWRRLMKEYRDPKKKEPFKTGSARGHQGKKREKKKWAARA